MEHAIFRPGRCWASSAQRSRRPGSRASTTRRFARGFARRLRLSGERPGRRAAVQRRNGMLRLVEDPVRLRPERAARPGRGSAGRAGENRVPAASASRARLRGAAAGAVIGEVANNDASEGAEIGAAAGVAGGRPPERARPQRSSNEQAPESAKANEDQQKAAQQQQVDDVQARPRRLPGRPRLLRQVMRLGVPPSGRRLGASCQRSRGTIFGSGGSPS